MRRRRAVFLFGIAAAVLSLPALAVPLLLPRLGPGGGESLAALPRGQDFSAARDAAGAAAVPGKAWHENGRTIQEFTIEDPELGRIAAVLSLPDPLPARALPLVVVLASLLVEEKR